GARALIKSIEAVARADERLDLDAASATVEVAGHAHEHGEEVVEAVAQLLHVGVLVGRTLVAVDGEALPHLVALTIEALADRLDDELLKVAREQGEAIFVGEDDHVPKAMSAALLMPHPRQQGGRVATRGPNPAPVIHGRRAAQ